MNSKDYLYMDTLEKTQPEIFDFITGLTENCHNQLSFASHEINNQLSFIRSCYQLISKTQPAAKEFPFWTELGDSINSLISYMERTALYRYSFKYIPDSFNLTQLLYTLPEILDEHYPDEIRNFTFDIDTRPIIIYADKERIYHAFSELIDNACEASADNDTIGIHSFVDEYTHTITIRLTNCGTISLNSTDNPNPLINLSESLSAQLCTPFYSSKKAHSGLGLAIVSEICHTHHAEFSICCDNNIITVQITFPIISIG